MAIAIVGCGSSSGMQCRRSIWKANSTICPNCGGAG